MMSKTLIAVLAIAIVAGGGAATGYAMLHLPQEQAASSSQSSAKQSSADVVKSSNSAKSANDAVGTTASSNAVSDATSKASSYSTSPDFKPAGETQEAASSMSSVMSADTGVPITDDMIREARQQLQSQGVSTGAFSDLDIANVINTANSESLDYKTAIQQLFPHYFE
ncbi:hypothetical protein ACXN5V_04145 [Weissella confusa]